MRKRTVTGLALDAGGTLWAVELASTLRGPSLVRAARFPGTSPEPSEWAVLVGRAREEGFGEGATVLGVPSHLVFHRTLAFPFRGRARVASVLAGALEGEIPLAPAETFRDHLPLPSPRGSAVLAVLCPRPLIAPLLPLFPHLPVVQTGALGLAAGARGVGFTDGVAMLAGGDAVTAVALRQGRVADLRRLRASDPARLADQAASAANEMDPGGRILLAGPSGERLLLRSLLRERGLAGVEEPEDAPLLRGAGDDPLAFLPAVGLALAALGRGVDLDLTREERSGGSWEWTADRKRLAALAGVVVLLGAALAVADQQAVRAEHAFWQGNLRQSWTELFPSRKLVPGKEKELLQVEVKAMEKRLADLTTGGGEGEGGTMPVLADLSRAVPPELDLGVDELALDPGRLRLEGSLPSFEAIDRLKSLLEATPRFSGVEVQNARVGAKPDRVNFRLKAEVN